MLNPTQLSALGRSITGQLATSKTLPASVLIRDHQGSFDGEFSFGQNHRRLYLSLKPEEVELPEVVVEPTPAVEPSATEATDPKPVKATPKAAEPKASSPKSPVAFITITGVVDGYEFVILPRTRILPEGFVEPPFLSPSCHLKVEIDGGYFTLLGV